MSILLPKHEGLDNFFGIEMDGFTQKLTDRDCYEWNEYSKNCYCRRI
jgi:hypothetical protein